MDPEQIATAFWRSPKGLIITGLHGQILATNPAFCKRLGFDASELRGSLCEVLIPPEDRRIRTAEWARLLIFEAGGAPAPARYLTRNGDVITVIETRSVLCGDNGAVAGVFALVEAMPDLAMARAVLAPLHPDGAHPLPVAEIERRVERRKVAADGADGSAFFRRLYEVAGEAVFVADAETGIVMDCNQQAVELVAQPAETIIGSPQSDLHPDDQRDHYWDLFCHRARQTGRQVSEVLVRRSDGTLVPVEITSTTMAWQGRRLVIGIFKDITERRRTEAALLAFANRMHAILSSMFDAVITADDQGVIETFNDAAERLFGWRAYEVIGRNVRLLIPPTAQEQQEAILGRYRRGGSARIMGKERELVAQRRDGSLVPIELAVTEILDRGDLSSGARGLGRRSFVGVIRDITERKTTEAALLSAKSQAELANRAKSEFLAHMSHELRTPLNAIIGFSEILMRELFGPMAPRYVEYAATIHESGQHLLHIINDLLDMARIEAGRFELVEDEMDVPSLLDSCLSMMQARADDGEVALWPDVQAHLPRVLADRRSVMQVLLNLLSNSVKFTPRGGAVTVSGELSDSGQVVIVVTDTGIGIDDDMLPRIFEPFQQADSRLSRKLEGTGLGLAISRNLMELHGGSLQIESPAKGGTIARMVFPTSRVLNPGS